MFYSWGKYYAKLTYKTILMIYKTKMSSLIIKKEEILLGPVKR